MAGEDIKHPEEKTVFNLEFCHEKPGSFFPWMLQDTASYTVITNIRPCKMLEIFLEPRIE
jgi:hypothetical protein